MKNVRVYAEHCSHLSGLEYFCPVCGESEDCDCLKHCNDYIVLNIDKETAEYYENTKSSFGWKVAKVIRKYLEEV